MSYDPPASEDSRIDVSALLGAVGRRLPRIILVTLGLLVAGFVVLMFMPRLYESSASILVEPRSNVYLRAASEQAPSAPASTAGLISSQIELLKSRDTLLKVIDELDLRSVAEFNGSGAGFSPLDIVSQVIGRRAATPNSIDERVLATLYERLTVVQERDSAIISVLVRSTDPQRAADIANAVANAHVARRADLSISDTADASSWLLDEINRLRVSVQEAESTVANFKVDNDLFTGQNNTSLLDQQLSTIATQINAAQERKNTALSRASLIRGLIDRGQAIEGVAEVQSSPIIQQLSQEKARLQSELAQRSATLLSNHPTIRALTAQVAELDNQIRQEGRRVAATLDAQAQIEAGLEESLNADLARAKASASTATIDTVTLDGLQREAKAQRDLLESYLLRYNEASSRVDSSSALPDVRVVSVAAPSVTPASPKTSLIMVAIGLVSIAVQVGAIAFGELMSGRALAPVVPGNVTVDEQEEPEAATIVPEDSLPDQQWSDPDPVVVDQDLEWAEEPDFAPSEAAPIARDEAAPDTVSAFTRALISEEPVSEPAPKPVVELAPVQKRAAPKAVPTGEPQVRLLRYADLVSDLVLGRAHLLLLADHGDDQPSHFLAEDLVSDALGKGLSVALIDAGTGRRTENSGITELSAGTASFGDVVQKSADNSFAEVTWGQGDAIARNSNRPLVLAEALGDIYEVVIILTGKADSKSMLGTFSELGGRIILVTGDENDIALAEATRQRLEDSGLSRVEIASLAEPVAA